VGVKVQFTFLNMAGKTLFIRDDAERAQWTQEEMTLDLEFPYLPNKVVSIGQRVFFKDPADGSDQIYEVRQAKTYQPDGYQQIVAEHICISELSDEHIDNVNLYGVPPQTALQTVLAGTLWSVGDVQVGSVAEQEQLRAEIAAFGLNGNVDLTSRPIIYPDKMKAAGYTDFDGDYATLYSTTYTVTNKSGNAVTLLMTPIQQNGFVLSYDELDDYVDGLCTNSNTQAEYKANDSRGLLMHFLPGTQVTQMDAIAEEAHNLSDEWEELNTGVLSSAELSRGSVWQTVLEIKDSWNVYIIPRVSLSSSGAITRRLDITHTKGEYHGLRLSIDKNMLDPSVTYDDSEVVTALFGYGGTLQAKSTSETDKEVDFADIVWTSEDGHPAKPKRQKYIEDPAATALYGRNGRARFGFYQNTDITDGEILLQKTWESLQTSCKPAISIEGTVADLYRMGYADQPIKLHDIALVEVLPIGYKAQIQIIRITSDLLDPSATTLTIGAYIPNIVYLERETNQKATGSRGGGGGNKSKESERHEFETAIESINNGTALRFRAFQNDLNDMDSQIKKQEASITIEHNRITQEVYDRRQQGTILSSTIEQTAQRLSLRVDAADANYQQMRGEISVMSNKIGLVVTQRDGQDVVNAASIVLGINNQDKSSSSYVNIQADKINLSGYVTASQLNAANARIDNLMTGKATASKIICDDMRLPGSLYYKGSKYVSRYITFLVNTQGTTESCYVLARST
jgi:hypothetical protein